MYLIGTLIVRKVSTMKKIVVTVLSVVIFLATAITFTACNDTSALEERIATLEQMLEQSVKGDKGDKGDTGEQGPKGDSGASESKVYKLGDTFTHVSAGIPLFSITMVEAVPGHSVSIVIKNLNLLGLAPNHFVRAQTCSGIGLWYSSLSFSTTLLPLGEESIEETLLSRAVDGMWYFGFPAISTVIPYAIFNLN